MEFSAKFTMELDPIRKALKGRNIPAQGAPGTVPRHEALVHGNALGKNPRII
jgi:hypothetical protein